MHDFQRSVTTYLYQRGSTWLLPWTRAIADQELSDDRAVLFDLVLHRTDAHASKYDESKEEPVSRSRYDKSNSVNHGEPSHK